MVQQSEAAGAAMIYTLQDKLNCAKRELALRRAVYPRKVSDGKMKQDAADRETGIMAAIVSDYEQALRRSRGEPTVF